VIDIAGLGKANHGMNKQIGLNFSGRAEREFKVGAMYWIPGLECHNSPPTKPGEFSTQVRGRLAQLDKIVMGRQQQPFQAARNRHIICALE
jgi:hypothetical protein